MSDHTSPQDRMLEAALMHVPFDGWGPETFAAAAADCDMSEAQARALFPRGALDLALYMHQVGDQAMVAAMQATDMSEMRFRDRVALGVRLRLEAIPDREAVRRAVTLFALPQNAAEGTRAIWGTADKIWTALGDSSDDVNWYTKRMTLSGVYGSCVLYWMGDDSPDHANTWAFLDRRIEDVMRFETVKAKVNNNPLFKPFLAGPKMILDRIKAPSRTPRADMPGHFTTPANQESK